MALIKCTKCGHMVSTKAEKCPKCGYPVHLSMKQQEETKQSVEPHATTFNTPQEEVINDSPQPPQRSNKKGIIIAVIVVVVVIIGCGVFALLNNNNGSNDQQQDTTAIADTEAEAIRQDESASDSLAVATRTNRQDIFSPDTLAVAKENDDVIVSDSCITEAWEYITLYGTMTDINGTYPIELSFEKDGNKLMNCIYTNVDLGGKIKMGGEIIGSELVFTGKDGMYKFQIRIDRDTFDGIATDGPKELSVSLNKKY